MDASRTWIMLNDAHTEYLKTVSPNYDEVLSDVSDRVAQTGSIGKSDIGALVFWKRLRADTTWVRRLMDWSDREVRAVTAEAVCATTDGTISPPEAAAKGRGALSALPGFESGDALASALLFASAPERLAVYDRRAQRGLGLLELKLTPAPGRYGRYMRIICELLEMAEAKGKIWKARDIDVALYQLGK